MAVRHPRSVDMVWPGFVDALASVLMVLIFILMIFALSWALLTQGISERDEALHGLEEQVQHLAEMLALEKTNAASLQDDLNDAHVALSASLVQREKLQANVTRLETLNENLSKQARAEVALLNEQMAALRMQLQELDKKLVFYEELNNEQKAEIHALGKRLNAALATKVQELSRYRSDFFGRLQEVLGDAQNMRIQGDRFVLQSEVLFDQGSADIGPAGFAQLLNIANSLKALSKKIPEDIDWILRVDGHTDKRPIATAKYPSNWELSSARAQAVIRVLMEQGIPPDRLAAAGFGQYHPLMDGNRPENLRQNRRIELKLTAR